MSCANIQPISCELHDHLELACVFRYVLDVQQKDGTSQIGCAVTTRTDSNSGEHLVLTGAAGEFEVPLLEINSIIVQTPGARFSKLVFAAECSIQMGKSGSVLSYQS